MPPRSQPSPGLACRHYAFRALNNDPAALDGIARAPRMCAGPPTRTRRSPCLTPHDGRSPEHAHWPPAVATRWCFQSSRNLPASRPVPHAYAEDILTDIPRVDARPARTRPTQTHERSGTALSLDAPRDARTGVRIPQAQRLNTTDCGARPHLDSGMVCTYRRAVMPNLPHAFRSRAAHNVNTPSSPDYRVPATRSSPPTHAACAVIAAPTPPDTSPCPTTPCLRSRAPKNDPRRPSSMHARPRHLARQQQRSTTGATTRRGVDVGWNTVAEAHTCTLPPRHGRPRPLYPPLARPRRS